ncbi:MAG: hypothetical protein OXH60_11845 [Rhodospirillales bacterium]|nr:hypothetical protein [Rhodospirillales bacterium]
MTKSDDRNRRIRAHFQHGPAVNLNSSAQQFADPETSLHQTAARSVGILWAAIGALHERFEPDECAGYFRHAGYGST